MRHVFRSIVFVATIFGATSTAAAPPIPALWPHLSYTGLLGSDRARQRHVRLTRVVKIGDGPAWRRAPRYRTGNRW